MIGGFFTSLIRFLSQVQNSTDGCSQGPPSQTAASRKAMPVPSASAVPVAPHPHQAPSIPAKPPLPGDAPTPAPRVDPSFVDGACLDGSRLPYARRITSGGNHDPALVMSRREMQRMFNDLQLSFVNGTFDEFIGKATPQNTDQTSSHYPQNTDKTPSNSPQNTDKTPSHSPQNTDKTPSHYPQNTDTTPSLSPHITDTEPPSSSGFLAFHEKIYSANHQALAQPPHPPVLEVPLIPSCRGTPCQEPVQSYHPQVYAPALPLGQQFYPLEHQTYPLEHHAYPIEHHAYPIEHHAYPIEQEFYPLEHQAYPFEQEFYPIEHQAYPIEYQAYPIEQEFYPLGHQAHALGHQPHPLGHQAHPLQAPPPASWPRDHHGGPPANQNGRRRMRPVTGRRGQR